MNLIIRITMIVSLLFITGKVTAENKHSTGFGVQYGGIVGYQWSTTSDNHNFRAALGLIGASVGYDYFVSDNFSIGSTYTISNRDVASLNLNYYSSGHDQEGWMIGLDIGHRDGQEQKGSGFFSQREKDSKNIVWLSFGYRY